MGPRYRPDNLSLTPKSHRGAEKKRLLRELSSDHHMGIAVALIALQIYTRAYTRTHMHTDTQRHTQTHTYIHSRTIYLHTTHRCTHTLNTYF